MADIINLRTARKRNVRSKKEAQADANRILHGTPTPIRNARKKINENEATNLDGQKLVHLNDDKEENDKK